MKFIVHYLYNIYICVCIASQCQNQLRSTVPGQDALTMASSSCTPANVVIPMLVSPVAAMSNRQYSLPWHISSATTRSSGLVKVASNTGVYIGWWRSSKEVW